MPAGYSRRPLAIKLGIKQGQKLAFLNPPVGYDIEVGELPDGVTVTRGLEDGLDFIHLFSRDRATLASQFPGLKRRIKRDGMIWVSWPKRASQLQTDLNENVVRALGLKIGMVDVKICAIDEAWSGLKFVIRVKDRR